MGVEYLIAVIGSGPAGMSAAARAAKNGQSHILLERAPHLTHTVYKYPKRKHVMAAPHRLEVIMLHSHPPISERLALAE